MIGICNRRTGGRGYGEFLPASPGRKGAPLQLLFMGLVCLALVFGIVRPFVIEAFRIPSGSMFPTLKTGDHVLVNKLAYRFGGPERGDLAVFRGPGYAEGNFVKRVVGLPGDTIVLKGGVLSVNGKRSTDHYVDRRASDGSFYGPTTVPEGHVFVLGDNRADSIDSRVLGPIPEETLLGEAFLRLWPLPRLGHL